MGKSKTIKRLIKTLDFLVDEFRRCLSQDTEQGKVKVMFVVNADHAPVDFKAKIDGIKDSEGNTVDRSEVFVRVSTSNSTVLTASYDNETDTGVVEFGAIGDSDFVLEVVDKDEPEQVIARYENAFKLVADNPETVDSVTVEFAGLTETGEPTPTTETPAPNATID